MAPPPAYVSREGPGRDPLLAPQHSVVSVPAAAADCARGLQQRRRWRSQEEQRLRIWAHIAGAVAVVCVAALALLGETGGAARLVRGAPGVQEGAASKSCEETYGFLPCSDSLAGNLSLMVAYGYMLLTAAKFISEGSEMMLQVLDPGLIGGLLLPILGAFPDTLLIAVSGLGGSAEEAQDEVLVGMGVLAGSTVMILTIAWAGSLLCGRCDLSGVGGTAKDRTLTKKWDLLNTGVTTDEQTRWGAWIMIITMSPYVIMQIPLLDGREATDGRLSALVGLIIALLGLVGYCIYQVTSPWLQNKRIENARMHYIRTMALRDLHSMAVDKSWGGLLEEDNQTPNADTLHKMFAHFDQNNDGRLQQSEVKALILGMGMQHQGAVPEDQELTAWLQDFDKNTDGNIGEAEFTRGMANWIHHVIQAESKQGGKRKKMQESYREEEDDNSFKGHADKAKVSLDLMKEVETEEEEEEGEGDKKPLTKTQIVWQAVGLMVLGAALVAVFADPMVDSVSGFSTASGIPPFFVAFVVTPVASTASELVSSLIFALKKRKRTISLTNSQVYGAISMNNTMCLGVFLGIVYARNLKWQFSSEVTIILLVTLTVGIIGGLSKTFKSWLALPVLSLYPLSIAVVAFLDYVLGWQ